MGKSWAKGPSWVNLPLVEFFWNSFATTYTYTCTADTIGACLSHVPLTFIIWVPQNLLQTTFLWPQYIAQVTTQSRSQVPELMVPRSSLNQWQTAVDRQYSTFLTLRWENLGPVLHHISEAPSGIEAQMLPTITCSLTQSVWFLPFLVSFPYFHTNPYWSHLRNKLLALESLLQRVCSLVGQTALCDPGCKSLLGVIL